MRNARKSITALVAVLGLLAFASAPAWAGQGYEKVTSNFGSAGSGPGQFKEPTTIAVNDETEEVYVLDSGNDRVERFALNKGTNTYEYKGQFDGTGSPTGKFLEPSNVAVDNSCASQKPTLTELTTPKCSEFDPSNGDVYVGDVGHGVIDKFSAGGEYKGQLTGLEPATPYQPVVPNELAMLNVAVDTSGTVWVADGKEYAAGAERVGYVFEFGDTGGLENQIELRGGVAKGAGGFAVDAAGNIYLGVLKFVASEGYQRTIINESGLEILPGTVAIISSTGNLLVDGGSSIRLFKAPLLGGALPVLQFPATGLSESADIAVNGANGEGTVYATQTGADDVAVFDSEPAKAPEVAGESASSTGQGEGKFAAVIDPENRETTYTFEYASSEAEVLNGEGERVSGPATISAEFGDQEVSSPVVEPLSGLKTTYYRVVAENEESKGTPTYGKVEAYTKLPLVGNEKFSGLTSTSAKLEATINPVFNGTNYVFEYATEATGETLKGTIAKVPGPEIQAGGAPEPVSTEITGLQPGQTYYYRVVAVNQVVEDGRSVDGHEPVRGPIEEFTSYAAPAVTTGGVQNITGTAATLSGEVDPEGTEATYHFAYISETGFQEALENHAANPASPNYQEELAKGAASPYAEGETTATFSVPVSASPQAVGPIPADGLLPGETYHYALVAVNKFAIQTIGADQTFTTAAGRPPLVSTGGASNVGQNAATLSGTVTTSGLQTNYGFEIETEPFQPGAHVPATGLGAIGGSLTEEVHLTLGELQPGTTYYYRVTATNADGTVQGAPSVFTTPGFPSLISPPASPPLIAYTSPGFPAEAKANGTSTKTLTAKEKLANALKVCRKDRSKSKKAKCEKAADKKYPTAKAKKKRKKK